MRLLRIITTVNPKAGGPVEGIKQISPLLAAQDCHAEVACLDSPDSPWLADFPLPVFALGPGKTGYSYAPKLVPWLREKASRYDAVIVHGLWQFGSFAAWRALQGSATPYFVYTHGMLDPWFKQTYPLKHLKKSLYWPWAEYRVLRDARAVIFTCEEEKRLARLSFRLYRANEEVVSYGTAGPTGDPDALRAAFLGAHPELAGRRLLLFLSRLHAKKGCDLLLEAFAETASSNPALHLVMAGPDKDGLLAVLQAQARALGIAERITWPGMLAGERKWGAFLAADAFALPSHQENFGIAVAEALACGLPALISDKVNIWREIVEDGAGLVAEDSRAGTVRLLREWLALSPDALAEMGRRAQACFAQRFEIGEAAQSFLRLMQSHGVGTKPRERV